MATTLSMSAFTAAVNTAVTPSVSSDQQSISGTADAQPASVGTTDTALLKAKESEEAAKIDAYFTQNGMPLAGYGIKMVTEAEKHNIDWRLIPAIAIRESTGGLHQCKSVTYSPFGFGSCHISFKSYNDAIEVVATNLGGDNPNTAMHYQGKSTKAILLTYNPPSVVPHYADQVMSLMTNIDNTKV
ncbi:MAG: hypothetical protein JWM92_419 [Candidatus Nomurabacteria bacterium]|nr:hypothetical protein [Candidatus Nomurabacteria bacterium]